MRVRVCVRGYLSLQGFFYEPTILADVQEGVRIVDEEQFGPVMPLIKYSDVDDAMARANDTDFGLGGSVCTILHPQHPPSPLPPPAVLHTPRRTSWMVVGLRRGYALLLLPPPPLLLPTLVVVQGRTTWKRVLSSRPRSRPVCAA